MIERIEQLRQEGEAAIAAATTSDALEQARVQFLGRKAELPNMLRGVAQLPPEQRGVVGKAANVARQARAALNWPAPSWSSGSRPIGSTSRCRARPCLRPAGCTC